MLIDKLNMPSLILGFIYVYYLKKVRFKNNNFKMFKLKNYRLIFKILCS